MSLKAQIQEDLVVAMKARDSVKVSTLRMLKSAIMAFEVSGKTKVEASEENVLDVLKREVKKRKESIHQFEEGGRHDLACAEQAELVILEAYLPEMMTEEQIADVVRGVVSGFGVVGPGDVGRVMGAAMGRLKGQADGARVKDVVQRVLAE